MGLGSPRFGGGAERRGGEAADSTAGIESLDRWLIELLGDEGDVALVAVGSFGRGDLAPHSDLDVVLVHRGRRDIATVANRVWYPIWDRGIALDHSVRTLKEALRVAGSDLKAALGLLDGRFVAGDPQLATDLLRRVEEQWRRHARRWLPALRASVEERHAKFGEVAFLLEPDLKEGRGGLRDVHALSAVAKATPVVGSAPDRVSEQHQLLAQIRSALHTRAGRAVDRLALQEQDGVADALGFGDADALMASVAGAARAISYVSDDAWRRVTAAQAGPRGRAMSSDRDLGRGVRVVEGEVVAADPARWLDAAAAAAELDLPIAPGTLARFAEEAPPPPGRWPDELRQALVSLLAAGDSAVPVLEALDHHGLLVRLLPEWASVRHRPQRNAYHRFTVDRHLCEAAAAAAPLRRDVARPDLLLVGAWLHDIGKGFPGDHTTAGMKVVADVGARMGFEPDDVAVLVDLVRHHLLLPDVATRRDLDDPATVELVAQAVKSVDTLELLAALTRADSLATGPSAWSEWKAGLVSELVARTRAYLRGEAVKEWSFEPPAWVDELERATTGVVIRGDDDGCTIVAEDHPGLLSVVAGVLALHGLDVRSATVGSTADNRAVEVIDLVPGPPPDWDRVAEDVAAALDGNLALEVRLVERARSYARRYQLRAARSLPAQVLVDDRASRRSTVLEVRAPDAVGVLWRITSAIAACGLDIRSARVTTIGHEVVDAFYVVDARGERLSPEQTAVVRDRILRALAAA